MQFLIEQSLLELLDQDEVLELGGCARNRDRDKDRDRDGIPFITSIDNNEDILL
mgnify:CR=1 FL=1